MISRRRFAAGAASIAAWPLVARATGRRIELTGSLEQGGLVVGKTDAGASVQVDGKTVRPTADGRFAFGFEYDRTKPAMLRVEFPDRSVETREVAPVQRQYEIQRIDNLPPQQAHPSDPDIVARIAREHALVGRARNTDSDLAAFEQPFDWPAKGILSGVFGSQRILNGTPSAPHFGVDIAGGEGAPVSAPADGAVLVAEQFFLEGGYTLIDHGHGVFTGYMHQSVQLVKAGDMVRRGQQIGNIGHTGRATGPHLHWQMNWFQVRLDPSRWTMLPAPSKA